MRAMVLRRISQLDENVAPLVMEEVPVPSPLEHQVLLKVHACGVCHTELDEIEGRTPPPQLPVVPGHQVVGEIVQTGDRVDRAEIGKRVGVGWIFSSCGGQSENLSPEFLATGRDVNGGYAEYMVADARYVFPIPDVFTDHQAAPLLCGGAIGYRSLKLTNLSNGQTLGLTGFGASAHMVLQLARFQYPDSAIFVFARDKRQREFARNLGAAWVGDTDDDPPRALDAIIDTTPAWKPVVHALRRLAPGGRLVINAIRKVNSDRERLLELEYHRDLWMEKEIKSVANITSADLSEFLPIAARIPLEPAVRCYPLKDANRALLDIHHGGAIGANVLKIGD